MRTPARQPVPEPGTGPAQEAPRRQPGTEASLWPKLAVSQPADRSEREADAFAAQATGDTCNGCDAGQPCSDCSGPKVHRSAAGPGPPLATKLALGGGEPLASADREHFEPQLGTDLGNVRVHTGPQAADATTRVAAHAFTAGSDIAFAPGKYQPETKEGRKLLAHELTHVVQTGGQFTGDIHRQPAGSGLLAEAKPPDEATMRAYITGEAPLTDEQRMFDQLAKHKTPMFPGSAQFPEPGGFRSADLRPKAPPGAVCPGSCHQTPQELWEAQQRRNAEAAAERERKERHQRWEASHRKEHGAFLGRSTTLADDIAAMKAAMPQYRLAVLRAAIAQPPSRIVLPPSTFTPLVQAGRPAMSWEMPRPPVTAALADAWVNAYQETVVLEALVAAGALTPEGTAPARAALSAFYGELLPLAEAVDTQERARQRESEQMSAALTPPRKPCPNCHSPAPLQFPVYVAGPPSGPWLRDLQTRGLEAATGGQWAEALRSFGSATTTMDTIVLSYLPGNDPAVQAFTYAAGLLERQLEMQRKFPDAQRVRAVFYPKDKFVTSQDDSGQSVEVANGIPWYFYLTHTPSQNELHYPEGFEWVLRDITSPGRPQVSYGLSDQEKFTRSYAQLGVSHPPPALFARLNNKLIFPEGMLYWTNPDDSEGELRTDEPRSLGDWLGYIGLGIAGLAIILATAGLATPGVLAGLGVAAAGFSIGSTLADLQEKSELGIRKPEDTAKALLFIAADVASILSLGLGKIASKAAEAALMAGRVTRMTIVIERAAVLAEGLTKVLNTAVMITVSHDFIRQYQAIMSSGLSPEERRAALQRLAMSGLLLGTVVLAGAASGRAKPGEPPPGAGKGPGAQPAGKGQVHAEPTVTIKLDAEAAQAARPPRDTGFLERTGKSETLSPGDAARELQLAKETPAQKASGEPGFAAEHSLAGSTGGKNTHTWRQKADKSGGWCRFTKKKCYSPEELRIGAGSQAERVTAANLADVAAVRASLRQRPASVRKPADHLDWADYVFYAERRLRMIEDALKGTGKVPDPPRTFESFRTAHPMQPQPDIVRLEIQGARFEAKTRKVFEDALGPERAKAVYGQVWMSESAARPLNPAEKWLTRADFFYVSSTGLGATAFTNKSRSVFHGSTVDQAEALVRKDLDEAVTKYSGHRVIRKTGEIHDINQVYLVYEAALVPQNMRPVIQKAVKKFEGQYKNTSLSFDVIFL